MHCPNASPVPAPPLFLLAEPSGKARLSHRSALGAEDRSDCNEEDQPITTKLTWKRGGADRKRGGPTEILKRWRTADDSRPYPPDAPVPAVYAEGAVGLTSVGFFRVGIPRTSRKRGTGLSGSVSGRRSIHLPSGGAVLLERGTSSPVSALSNMGVVAFFQRRKFHNRRHLPDSAMILSQEF